MGLIRCEGGCVQEGEKEQSVAALINKAKAAAKGRGGKSAEKLRREIGPGERPGAN